MAVSESVLNAVNLFSSTSVFNANKGSVGATDLNFIKQTTAELATEGGGIIAQSLGTNGYVKFANGLILQWGKTSSFAIYKSITFSYPISCSTCYVASATTGSTGETALQITNIGVSSCTIYRHYTGNSGGSGIAYVIVIGKVQQWGRYVPQNESLGYRITLPIPYTDTTTYIVVCSNDDTSNGYVTTSAARRHSNQNIDLVSGLSGDYYQSQPVDIIVCGWQQWGIGQSQAYYPAKTLTFPIAYSSAPYTVIANWKSGGAGEVIWNAMSAQSWSKTGFKCINGAGESAIASWFSLGVQQWGKRASGTSTTVIMPITFPSAAYAIIVCGVNSGTVDNHLSDISLTTSQFTVATSHSNYNVGSTWVAIGV